MTTPLSPSQIAELRERAEWQARVAIEGSQPREDGEAMLRLLATVEAQAAVIARCRYGWKTTNVDRGFWYQDKLPPERWEPMSPAEQVVVYGEVLKAEESG